jgi:hypothetical protein
MKRLISVIVLLGSIELLFAQADQAMPGYSKGIIYNREFSVDATLHTGGMGIGVNFGKLKSYFRTRYYNISISEIRHPKEFRQSFDFRTPSVNRIARSFIFGKQNNLYTLRGGIGEKRYFSEKALNKGLAVGISYSGGPSLGLLKPYYLDLIRFQEPDFTRFFIQSESFSEENADLFLDINSIYGATGLQRGLSQLSIQPGAHAKIAVHLDWGAYDEFVKSVEAGVALDVFLREMPIMIDSPRVPNAENKMLFINLYINLQLGKRW